MRIHSVSLKNYRGYRDTVKIFFDDLTVFIGKNDVGKSTVLEALDVFFNDGKGSIKFDKKDVNIYESRQENYETEITVVFEELPKEVIIDSSSKTTLASEYLLNDNNKLEVIKRFNNGGSPKIFIKALHPTNSYCKDLLLKKNAELKRIVNEQGIECEDKANNVTLRKAIWNYYNDDLQLDIVDVDAAKEDAKKIWDKISTYMPVYSLFQSDRENSDSDNEIQDPLQSAVKQILADPNLQTTLSSIAEEVIKKLSEVSERTLSKLQEMDPSIAKSLKPTIPSVEQLKWTDVFKKVSISGDEDIPINKRGSGVKRLILLNFFRAEAERNSQNGDDTGVIYAIEEPETSQHYANQRILIKALKNLAQTPDTQIILTTHSGIIVKELEFKDLRLISDVNEKKQILDINPNVLNYPSLNEVNYSAFGEVSEEYHNELYGFLEFQGWISDFEAGRPQYKYKKLCKNGNTCEKQMIRTKIIRHQIHHPENKNNIRFTSEELKESIEEMRQYIRKKAEEERLWEPVNDVNDY